MNPAAKYLAHYAVAEVHLLDDLPGLWQQVLVIPAYREELQSLLGMQPALAERDTLLILVINTPAADLDRAWAVALVDGLGPSCWRRAHLSLHRWQGTDVLLADRCIDGPLLEEGAGVGGARRIAADIAAQLIHDKKVSSHWIHNTDADARLPAGYFAATDSQPAGVAACVYPFEHIFVGDEASRWPMLVYEWHLHYYVDGLRRAGSAYAWHTLGSTLALDYRHYAMVRGFPLRNAGEDFHILNKLAKTGAICSLLAPSIQLSARQSARVPFGTGPGVRRIAELADPWCFQDYHPASFELLKSLITLLDSASREPRLDLAAIIRSTIEHKPMRKILTQVCAVMQLDEALRRARAATPQPARRQRHLQQQLDALRSLQLLHYLRDHVYPRQSLAELLNQGRDLSSWRGDLGATEAYLQASNQAARQRLADGALRGLLPGAKLL